MPIDLLNVPAVPSVPLPTTPSGRVLMHHQVHAVDRMIRQPYVGIWVDIGGGKTSSVLTALQHIRPMGHILVIAPGTIARSTWIDEIEEQQFPIRTRSLIVNERDKNLTRAQRLQRFKEVFTDPPTMYFINQDLISRPPLRSCKVCHGEGVDIGACLSCQGGLVDQMPIEKRRGPDGRLHNTIVWPFQTVIIDESQEFKSPSSRRFQALAAVRPAISRFIELTGTPDPQGLEDLWSQMFLLDQGAALGRTITEYRERYFTPKMTPGVVAPTGWIPNPGAEEEIHRAIAHLVMSAKNTTIVLPERTIEDVHVALPADVMASYKKFKKDLVIDLVNEAALKRTQAAFDTWLRNSPDDEAERMRNELAALSTTDPDAYLERYQAFFDQKVADFEQAIDEQIVSTVIAQNEAVLSNKLMQFASGTLYTNDPDEPTTKKTYTVLHDAKIQMVAYRIRNNGGGPVLLAYHHTSDKEQLYTQLNKMGLHTEIFDGSRAMIKRWNNREIRVMMLHPKSAGAGLNLQHGGSMLIWYMLPAALKLYLQTNGRIYRPGQKEPVTILRLIAKGTHDERMPVVLMTKDLAQQRTMAFMDIDKQLQGIAQSGNQGVTERKREALRAELDDVFTALGIPTRVI